MFGTTTPKFFEKIAERLENKIVKIELICLFSVFIGIVLKLSEIGFGNIVIILSLSILSILYYFSAFRPIKSEKNAGLMRFICRLTFWGYSIAIMGILFTLMNYSGSEIMIKVGFSTMVFSLLANIYSFKRNSENSEKRRIDFLRNIIFFAITFIFYITPQQEINKVLKNHNNSNTDIELVEQ